MEEPCNINPFSAEPVSLEEEMEMDNAAEEILRRSKRNFPDMMSTPDISDSQYVQITNLSIL